MTLRSACCAVLLSCVAGLGCQQTNALHQEGSTAQAPASPPVQLSQIDVVTETPRFVLQTTDTFFAKPTGVSSDDFSR